MNLTNFVFVALIGEALWETSKLIWQHGKFNIDRIGAVIIGILLALFTELDLFKTIGTPLIIPFLGQVLTGLLLSRGANFMHDIIGSMDSVYAKNKQVN